MVVVKDSEFDAKFMTDGKGETLTHLGWLVFYAVSIVLFCRYESKARARLSVRARAAAAATALLVHLTTACSEAFCVQLHRHAHHPS